MAMEQSTFNLELTTTPNYSIKIGADLFTDLAAQIPQDNIAIISDSNVYPLYGHVLESALTSCNKQTLSYQLPAGEASKSVQSFEHLLSALAKDNFDRNAAIIALGGGVIGDLAGFVAASYMRGIAFYQCPTSLLAMVDASIGGKTGINLKEGKNLVGAFWQPKAVSISTSVLKSLPLKTFKQGAVELFKHGLLADESILRDVYHPEFTPQGKHDFLADILARAARVKVDIVSQDEREAGVRAHLNLGHSLAHALEAASHHQLQHGDAVAYGLVFSAYLSAKRGYEDETSRLLEFLQWLEPKALPKLSLTDLLPYLQRDKKNAKGKLRFVLLQSLGQVVMVDDIAQQELSAAWNYLQTLDANTAS